MTPAIPNEPAAGFERAWPAAVAVGIVLRIAVVFMTPVFPIVANTWDSVFYNETAAALAGGEGYTFQGEATALYPPGFPAVLALGYAAFGPLPRVGQLMNVGASLALLAAAAALGGCLFGRRAGRTTALVLALEPSQIVMPAFLMSEVVCGAALMSGLALAVWSLPRKLWGGVLAAAVLTALAGMTRGHAFLVVPVALAALWKWPGVSGKRTLTALLMVLVVGGSVVTGWLLRNQDKLGAPVAIATNAGINLWLGNNPNSRGGRADPPGGVPQTGDEVQDERIARERALAYVKGHPARSLLMLPVKGLRLVVPAPALTYRAELRRKWGRFTAGGTLLLAQLAHVLAWVGAGWLGVRTWRLRRQTRQPWMATRFLAACLLIWILGHLPFLGGARYFFPVQPLLWVAAAPWLTGGTILTPVATDSES